MQRGGTTIAKIEREETRKKLARLFRVIFVPKFFCERLVRLSMLSIWFNAAFVICSILGKTKRRLKDRFNEHRRPILNPSGSYIQTAVSEHFPSISHSVSHMLLISIETLRYGRACLRKERKMNLINKPKTIEPLRMNKRDEQKSLCIPYLSFDFCFLAATPYHVIPCNFRLIFYSSIFLL